MVSLITERRVSQPWGPAGGEPEAVGENWLLPAGDEERSERLPDKCTVALKAGDVVRMLTPGGGVGRADVVAARGAGSFERARASILDWCHPGSPAWSPRPRGGVHPHCRGQNA